MIQPVQRRTCAGLRALDRVIESGPERSFRIGRKEAVDNVGCRVRGRRLDLIQRFQKDTGVDVEKPANPIQNIWPWKAFTAQISIELSTVDAQLAAQL